MVAALGVAQSTPVVVFDIPGSFSHSIATSGEVIHATAGIPLGPPVLYSRSTDRGRTWTAPVPLFTGVNGGIYASGDHVYAFGWGDESRSSSDGGLSWGPLVRIGSSRGVHAWHGMGPVAHVLLRDGWPGGVEYARSTNGGASWGGHTLVTASAWNAWMLDAANAILVAWELGGSVYVRRSADGGLTWPAPVQLASGAVGWQILARGQVVHLVHGGTSGIVHRRSTDAGQNWSPPTVLAAPAAGFALAADETGLVCLFTLTGTGVDAVRSADGGASWNTAPTRVGTHRWIHGVSVAARGGRLAIAWSDDVRQSYAASADGGQSWSTTTHAGGRGQPRISLRGDSIAVAWSRQDWLGPAYVWWPIQLWVSGDAGATWAAANSVGSGHGSLFDFADGSAAFVWAHADLWSSPRQVRACLLFGYQPYGTAKSGSGGIWPTLRGHGEPLLGRTIHIAMDQALGGAPALIGATFTGPASIPFGGGSILLQSPITTFWGMTSGVAGNVGAGSLSLAVPITNTAALRGLRLNWQGFVVDPAAAGGFAATAGLELWIL